MSATVLLALERAKLYRAAVPHGAYLDYLRDSGLGVKSLADPDPFHSCGCLAVTTIRPNRGGGFDFAGPSEDGVTVAAVIEAYGSDGETVADLVAWPIDHPNRVRTMFGRCDMLGAWNIFNPVTYAFDKPLMVYCTALAWLQAGCRGCVILDPPSAARRLLNAPGPISGEDRAHSEELAALVASLIDGVRIVAPVTVSNSSDFRKAA